MRPRPYDIRTCKKNLRDRYKAIRKEMPGDDKRVRDARIRGRILHLPEYRGCKTLLCFVSTGIEVDTRRLIQRALADGKAVAVPYCLDGTRTMHFYRIGSLNDLRPRTFGVLEPDPETAQRVTDFRSSICVLPGLAFDTAGYRLGYGGGYYDRFLSKVYHGQGGITVGICYNGCITHKLPRGRYDIPCDILVTERYIRRISGGAQNLHTAPANKKQKTRGKGPCP